MRAPSSNRGFTLVEVLVSMSLGMVVMLAVFSAYLFLGRSLTRLSYRSALENQSRKIMAMLSSDIRSTKAVTGATDTNLTLSVYNPDGSIGTVVYDFSTFGLYANKLTRNGIPLVKDVQDSSVAAAVILIPPTSGKIFNYSTTSGNTYTTSGTGPTSQSSSTLVLMSIKQVAINFSLQAGDPTIQGQLGTLVTYPVSSSKMPLISHPLPDGT